MSLARQPLATAERALLRRRIRVRGVVQGVGFRPFVYRAATDLALNGTVCNDGAGVSIDAQGGAAAVAELLRRLRQEPPPLARVDAIEIEECPLDARATGFHVVASRGGRTLTAIGHDTAICSACLEELFDAGNRRYRYAFTNCTDCGPRYTITRALPYDRKTTSLAPFDLCAPCRAEYEAPANRRFHAEATACRECGPELTLIGGLPGEDPVAGALRLLLGGAIVAIKGLGGYHLACDARSIGAIARLRQRKQREEQPFAVMGLNIASAERVASVSADECALLESAERPVVLVARRPDARDALPGVADGCEQLGFMLPYTPIQYLLWHEAAARPLDRRWLTAADDLMLIMTSANVHGEPLVIDDQAALAELAGIADAWLVHDRQIVTRCDDSVMRVSGGRRRFVRRARGAAPRSVPLGRALPSALGLGAHYKATCCVTRGAEAFVSPYVGDLDSPSTRRALDGVVEHLLALTDATPTVVAHDLHPDFYSTHLAARLAARRQLPLLAVQHHHAHVAAVLAEHHLDEPVLGLALDGVGYGLDGTAWGGELLWVDGATMTRIGHLAELPLVGGDRAAREPWRMAAAVLQALGRGAEIAPRFVRQPAARAVADLLAMSTRLPLTSSLGRWFDAAAGLLGLRQHSSFEGQAAMLLEGLAARSTAPAVVAQCGVRADVLDLLPLCAALVDAADRPAAAAAFHWGLASGLADWVAAAAERTGTHLVACGGGCFVNVILAARVRSELERRGITMLEPAAVPPNDGSISLGQCWVAQRTGR